MPNTLVVNKKAPQKDPLLPSSSVFIDEINDLIENSVKPRCYIPWQEMIIGADGNVSPCSYYQGFGGQGSFIGNVNENTIEEIWNGPGYQQLREFMLSEEGKDGCKNCLAIKQGLMGTPRLPSHDLMQEYTETPASQNALLVLKEISEKKGTIKAKPTRISYTPSQRCNFRCTMCYQDYDHSLSLKEMEKVDQEIMALMPYMADIIAGGGEPFLLPIWQEFVRKYERDINPVLRFSTTTNGSLVDEELLKHLNKFPEVVMNFSIDSPNKPLFEQIRRYSSYETVFGNIQNCLDKRNDGDYTYIQVTGCMTVMKSNIHEMYDMLKLMVKNQMPVTLPPLNVLPLDESLVCYHNSHVELKRIKEAIDKASNFIFRKEQILGDEYVQFEENYPIFTKYLQDNINMYKDMIPWHLMDIEHYRVAGVVPNFVPKYENNETEKLVSFFPLTDGKFDPIAKYYAPLKEGFSFEAWLPAGEYKVGFHPRNIGHMPHPHWKIKVMLKSNHARLEEISDPPKVKVIQENTNPTKKDIFYLFSLKRLGKNVSRIIRQVKNLF